MTVFKCLFSAFKNICGLLSNMTVDCFQILLLTAFKYACWLFLIIPVYCFQIWLLTAFKWMLTAFKYERWLFSNTTVHSFQMRMLTSFKYACWLFSILTVHCCLHGWLGILLAILHFSFSGYQLQIIKVSTIIHVFCQYPKNFLNACVWLLGFCNLSNNRFQAYWNCIQNLYWFN